MLGRGKQCINVADQNLLDNEFVGIVVVIND